MEAAAPVLAPAAAPAESAKRVLGRRALKGAFALGVRQVLVFGVAGATAAFLAHRLSPAEFGAYAVVLFISRFLQGFSDAGLGASLIRQESEPTDADYDAVFSAQQVLLLALVAVGWVVAPLIPATSAISRSYADLVRALPIAMFIASFGLVPSIRLERNLRYDRVARIEVGEALAFHAAAVVFVVLGFRTESFVFATLVQGCVVAVLAQGTLPSRIRWRWDPAGVKARLGFGLPFQGSLVVSVVKDSITPLLVGLVVGSRALGLVKWAEVLAAYSVTSLMILQRLYLPLFAKFQDDRTVLARVVSDAIRATNAVVAPLALATLVFAHPITVLVFGTKWLPALPYFYGLWLANLVVPTVTPLVGALNAVGRSRATFGFAVMWMLSTWVLGLPAILLFGTAGYVAANIAVQVTNLLVFREAKTLGPVRMLASASPAWAVAAASIGFVGAVQLLWPAHSVAALGLWITAALALYCASVAVFLRRDVLRVRVLLRG